MPHNNMNPFHRQLSTSIRFLAALAFIATSALAETPLTKEPFEVGGHNAFIIPASVPAPGKPWVWYAPTLGANLPGAGHQWYFERFQKAGISIAGTTPKAPAPRCVFSISC